MKRYSGPILALCLSLSALTSAAHAQEATAPTGPEVDLYSEADAQAVLNARLTALKTVLQLSSDQEKLWPPVEAVIRQINSAAVDRGKKYEMVEPPADFLDVVERIADAEAIRALDVKAFVAAARPLVNALSDEQKRRAPAFLGITDNPDAPQPSSQLWLFEDEQG